jgi:2-polyprenyl-3-methyl-5-hydroxy-6-metoxy-1,4-benzoquinol methylase
MQKKLYKKYITLWQQENINSGFSYRLPDYAIQYWLENLEKTILSTQQKNFLDIGAGNGRLSLLLLNTFYNSGAAIEVDADKDIWKNILEKNPTFTFHEGFLQDKFEELKDKKFDLIMLSEVFEHVPPTDIPKFLAKLYQVLSDDGRIFLTTPNFVTQGPAEKSPLWHEKSPYGHHKHYSLQELHKILEKFGFQIERSTFECNKFKIFYNKQFYKTARLDSKFLSSKKISRILKTSYQLFSTPLLLGIKSYFWLLSKLIYLSERKWNTEKRSMTIILSIKKGGHLNENNFSGNPGVHRYQN